MDNGDYLADWSDCAGSPNGLTPAGRRPGVCFHSVRRRSACGTAPRRRPGVAGEGRLSWQNEAFSRGQMRVEARHLLASGCRYRPPRLFLRRKRISMALDAPQRRQH